MSEKNYKSNYQSLQFYSIGGRWGYAIIRLLDSNNEEKVRLAKCKKKSDEFPSTKKYEWTEVDVKYIDQLSQVQKINFKPTDNFQTIADKVLEELALIKQKKEKGETSSEAEED